MPSNTPPNKKNQVEAEEAFNDPWAAEIISEWDAFLEDAADTLEGGVIDVNDRDN